jgi:ADP-heptose:LPS heptosyltransferase
MIYSFLSYNYNVILYGIRYYFNVIRKNLTFFRRPMRRILIVRFASLGDVVRSTAIVEILKRRYPHALIDYLTAPISVPILKDNPHINRIFTVEEIDKLEGYDWIINLQTPDPPMTFFEKTAVSYKDILKHLSTKLKYAFMSGRRIVNGREVIDTNSLYCKSELEELMQNALINCNDRYYDLSHIFIRPDDPKRANALKRLNLRDEESYLGIFLGTSTKGGYDNGFRAYSLKYLEKLVGFYYKRYRIIVVGQSREKTENEMAEYERMLQGFPRVINLVDKLSVQELIYVLARCDVFICSNSGPLHMAMALRTKTIGLFVNAADFVVSSLRSSGRYEILNHFEPCSSYNCYWKFFCQGCVMHRSYGCNLKMMRNRLDSMDLNRIDEALSRLLASKNVDTAAI